MPLAAAQSHCALFNDLEVGTTPRIIILIIILHVAELQISPVLLRRSFGGQAGRNDTRKNLDPRLGMSGMTEGKKYSNLRDN